MGLSFDMEPGSAESENYTASNIEKIIVTRNVDDEARTATAPDLLKSSGSIVPSSFQEQAKTSIVSEAEPEEGEIINSDDNEAETGEFEYEAISSDEEFSLRQKIEALEARNLELEKIASISARSEDPYDLDYGRPSIFNHYRPISPIIQDDKYFSTLPSSMRPKPALYSPKSFRSRSAMRFPAIATENISSDEVVSDHSDIISESHVSNSSANKSYGRAHKASKRPKHHHQHANKAQTRSRNHERKKERKIKAKSNSRSAEHGLRTKSASKGRGRRYSSSDDDCIEVTNQEELRAALNIREPTDKVSNRSTLKHKLNAINNKATASTKMSAKKRKRLRKVSAGTKVIQNSSADVTETTPNKVTCDNKTEDDDDGVSLEEQELRLIALKSAVLNKHEARKKRQQAMAVRPYSPTDAILPTSGDEIGDNSNPLDAVESDNNNMDISPTSSPRSNQCQPMDMELVSSNEDSKSPIFFGGKSETVLPANEQYLNWMCGMPLPTNSPFVEIDPLKPMELYPPVVVNVVDDCDIKNVKLELGVEESNADENDEASELRAQLIANLKTNKSAAKSTPIGEEKVEIVGNATETTQLVAEETDEVNRVESLEADCLRSLLLSSIKQKKAQSTKRTANEIASSVVPTKVSKLDTLDVNIDIPKLTSNLKEALKRLQSKQTKDDATTDDISKRCENQEQSKETLTSANANPLTDCDSLEKTADSDKLVSAPNIKKSNESTPSLAVPADKVQSPVALVVKKSPHLVGKVILPKKTVAINGSKLAKGNQLVKISAKDTQATNKVVSTALTTMAVPLKAVISSTKPITTQQAKPLPKIPNVSTSPLTVIRRAPTLKISPVILSSAKGKRAQISPIKAPSNEPIKSTIVIKTPTSTKTVSTIKTTSALTVATKKPAPGDWPMPNPVKKLIISLTQTDSSSDFDIDDDDDVGTNNGETKDLRQLFDNTSPASIMLDSPSMAPSSPNTAENNVSTSVTKTDSTAAGPLTDGNDDKSKVDDSKNAFQAKLDEYLKTVRAKIDGKPETTSTTTATTTTTKITIAKVGKAATPSTLATQSINLKSKATSTAVVGHLPISAQLEYRRLVNRMKMLEKQKEQKSRLLKQQQAQQSIQAKTLSDTANDTTFSNSTQGLPNLTVTVKNENRFIQTNDITLRSKGGSVTSLPPSDNVSKIGDSLKKKVLVKNTLNALAPAKSGELLAPSTVMSNTLSSGPLSDSKTVSVEAMDVDSQPALVDDTKSPTIPNITADDTAQVTLNPAEVASNVTSNEKPIEKKVKLLKSIEAQFNAHSCKSLDDLTNMYKLLCLTQEETKKQLELEKRLENLQRQCRAAEEELLRQKSVTQSMYPTIAETQKIISSNRSQTHKLVNYCNKLGRSVKGDEYKLTYGNEAKIREMIKSISQETRKLKHLKDTASMNEPLTDTEATADASDDLNGLKPTEERSVITESSVALCVNVNEISPTAVSHAPIADEHLVITVRNDQLTNPVQRTQQPDVEDIAYNTTEAVTASLDDDVKCGKYRSPLDYMREAGQRFADRNAIICPFDLMGRCEDVQCSYQHLSS